MQLQSDVLGFPIVHVGALDLWMSLLPITKVQFERFIAEENSFGDSWYDEVLNISPRHSWRNIASDDRESLFVTAIFPPEALAFAAWLGKDFDLPTREEWSRIYQLMQRTPLPIQLLQACTSHPVAKSIVDSILSQVEPSNMAQMSLLQDGIIEWVYQGQEFAGLGKPRARFLSTVFNPEVDEPLRPPRNVRSRYFGFRLVRRATSLKGAKS